MRPLVEADARQIISSKLFLCARFRTGKESFQEYMGGEVYHDHHKRHANRNMNWRRSPRATEEWIGESEIHVFCRVGEARTGKCEERDERLQSKPAVVVANAIEHPQQQDGHCHMKERE
jgi:hypothetical protein